MEHEWFEREESLAHKLYGVYTKTIELYRKPNITILFNDERRTRYLELINQFYGLLKDVYRLECECPIEDLDHKR
jgi:hypothetical protein